MEVIILGLLIGFIVFIVFYTINTFNLFVKLKMDVERQASHVEVHLKKKYDLVPALVEVVKGYAKHEKETFEEVTKLRSDWARQNPEGKINTSNMLDASISKLLLIQERYPALKADQSFMNLQRNLTKIENELVFERKIYNQRVSWYNVKIKEFPRMIFAKIFGYVEKPFFSIEE